jgi:lipoprotein-anchoring transpeptidase ErfK/SrfK
MRANRSSSRIVGALLGTIAALAPAHMLAARATPVALPRRIVVSIPDRKLALVDGDARIISVYDVAVGAPVSPSPIGRFTIVTRIPHPTYYRPGVVIGPGAGNPLGTRWIGLNEKGFGIHGTDEPGSIGLAKSHGCIRLRNRDVERLFEKVRAGDVVEIHAERTKELTRLFAAHPGAETFAH